MYFFLLFLLFFSVFFLEKYIKYKSKTIYLKSRKIAETCKHTLVLKSLSWYVLQNVHDIIKFMSKIWGNLKCMQTELCRCICFSTLSWNLPTVNDGHRLSYKQAHLMTVASVYETTHGSTCSDYVHHMGEKHNKTPAKYNSYLLHLWKNKIVWLQIWREDGESFTLEVL